MNILKKEERIQKRWNILSTNDLETFCPIIYLRFLWEHWFPEQYPGWTHANQLVTWRGKKRVVEIETKGTTAYVPHKCDKTVWMHPKSPLYSIPMLNNAHCTLWSLGVAVIYQTLTGSPDMPRQRSTRWTQKKKERREREKGKNYKNWKFTWPPFLFTRHLDKGGSAWGWTQIEVRMAQMDPPSTSLVGNSFEWTRPDVFLARYEPPKILP